MRKFLTVAVLLAMAVGLIGAAMPVAAQESEMSPAAVVEAVYAALEVGDVDAAVAMLADDAVLSIVPASGPTDGTFIGHEEIGEWFQGLVEDEARYEFSDVWTDGNMAAMKLDFYIDYFEELVGGPAEFDGVAVVQDGLLKSLSWVFTPEFLALEAAALERQAKTAVIERYFDDLWSQGNLDVVDEIISEDFVSHSFPLGEGRDGMREMVSGFHDAFPGVTIVLDQVVFDEDRAFVVSRMIGPDGMSETAEGDIEDILVFGMKDGQITDRWYFVPPE